MLAKVAILAGRGCLNSRDEVLQLAEKVAGPIIKPLLGKAVVPDNSPYTTGGIGLLGTAPSQDALEECDTLIIAGSGFPYMEFYPKPGKAKTVQIDIDPTRIGLRIPPTSAWWGIAERCCVLFCRFCNINRPQFPGEGSEAHEDLEQADGGARHADGHADEAASGDVRTSTSFLMTMRSSRPIAGRSQPGQPDTSRCATDAVLSFRLAGDDGEWPAL